MKKLLLIHPIHPYLKGFSDGELELFNQTIDVRYRKQGYEVYFLNFMKDRAPSMGIRVEESDHIINGDVSFENYTSPKGYDENRVPVHHYHNYDFVSHLIGPSDSLIIGGFDAFGMVEKFSEYYSNCISSNIMVDIELTKRFKECCHRHYFNPKKYNPQNIIMGDRAWTLYRQGQELLEKMESMIAKNPIYKVEEYQPTISFLEAYMDEVFQDKNNLAGKRNKIRRDLEYINVSQSNISDFSEVEEEKHVPIYLPKRTNPRGGCGPILL